MPTTLPKTRSEIDGLPYRLSYGHWGLSAWIGGGWGQPGERIAEAFFPVGARGPFDPLEVRNRVFAELDAKARAALAIRSAPAA